MEVRNLIIGLMASFGKKNYTVRQLQALTAPFGVKENALRTALSRLKAADWLTAGRQGKSACYFFSLKGSKKSGNIAAGFRQPDWDGWEGVFWGFLFSLPKEQAAERYRLRRKLQAYRFAPLYPGFWIRPRHREDRFMTELSERGQGTLLSFESYSALPPHQIAALWDIPGLQQQFKEDLNLLLQSGNVSCLSPRQALVSKMELGERIVPHLFADPLLPACYLPPDWKGREIREHFFGRDRLLTEQSRPFWTNILDEKE